MKKAQSEMDLEPLKCKKDPWIFFAERVDLSDGSPHGWKEPEVDDFFDRGQHWLQPPAFRPDIQADELGQWEPALKADEPQNSNFKDGVDWR